MLTWKNILTFAEKGNPAPERTVTKTEKEWRDRLTDEQYRVTRQHGIEAAFSSDMCSLFEPGICDRHQYVRLALSLWNRNCYLSVKKNKKVKIRYVVVSPIQILL